MRKSEREVEIKLIAGSAAAARRVLRQAGFRVRRGRTLEADTVFDTADHSLRRSGRLLRLREVRGRGILTFKGPVTTGRHKSREELEIEIPDPGMAQRILRRLCYVPVFRYEKYRTEFAGNGRGAAMLDETPIGVYLELEGPPRWIDHTARALGFRTTDYITHSYAQLYFDDCGRRGCPPGHMLFCEPPTS